MRRALALVAGISGLLGGLVAALPGTVGAAAPPVAAPAGGATGPIEDLKDLADLRARFTRDAGKPRLVLLLSPT